MSEGITLIFWKSLETGEIQENILQFFFGMTCKSYNIPVISHSIKPFHIKKDVGKGFICNKKLAVLNLMDTNKFCPFRFLVRHYGNYIHIFSYAVKKVMV